MILTDYLTAKASLPVSHSLSPCQSQLPLSITAPPLSITAPSLSTTASLSVSHSLPAVNHSLPPCQSQLPHCQSQPPSLSVTTSLPASHSLLPCQSQTACQSQLPHYHSQYLSLSITAPLLSVTASLTDTSSPLLTCSLIALGDQCCFLHVYSLVSFHILCEWSVKESYLWDLKFYFLRIILWRLSVINGPMWYSTASACPSVC